VIGCSRVSPGCEHCYAERLASTRLRHLPNYGAVTNNNRWNGTTLCMPERLDQPLRWKRPRKIFVNDMGDTFHPTVPFSFIAAIFGVMAACPQHTFQILTKRPARMREFFEWAKTAPTRPCGVEPPPGRNNGINLPLEDKCQVIAKSRYVSFSRTWANWECGWPLPNVHLGVTCEDQQRANERIPLLLQCPAAVRFVSAEPLLGPIDLPLMGTQSNWRPVYFDLNWVIVGGESGPRARPCDVEWIRSIRDQCKGADVACFIKQLGARPFDSKQTITVRYPLPSIAEAGNVLELNHRAGAAPAEWPEDLQVREYPR
jgi:protein gp37